VRSWHVTCCLLRSSVEANLTRGMADMDENAGNLIRTLRQKLGMTQEEFAHEIAVTVSTVNRWENAHAEPSKLAWKAIQDLARKRGLNEDLIARSSVLAEG
jgi:DNA-binding transcriptional regulator YiaG